MFYIAIDTMYHLRMLMFYIAIDTMYNLLGGHMLTILQAIGTMYNQGVDSQYNTSNRYNV